MLRKLFTSGTRVKLLTLFLIDPDREHYPREMERLTGENINGVRRELRNLEGIGLLCSTTRGKQRFYTVNRGFPLYPELLRLVLKTEGLSLAIRRQLEALGGISYAFLYGPSAREGVAWSGDLNLFLVGEVDRARFPQAVRELRDCLGREVRTLLITPGEFRDRLGNGEPALRNLMEGPKLVIIPLS